MPLRDLPLQIDYDPSSCPDVVRQFYEPALGQSVAYDRATYTFSAAGLSSAAVGLAGLIRNGGRIRLICHYEMDEPTVRAIMDGQAQAREALLDRMPPKDLSQIRPGDIRAKNQLEMLTWLIANRRLEIRIAIHSGIFHPKIGVMTDARGDRISFSGSANETDAGWSKNYEFFMVFTSWKESDRVESAAFRFDALWNNESQGIHVIPMPDEYEEYLKSIAPADPPGLSEEEKARDAYWRKIRAALESDPESTLSTIPAELWPHQDSFRRANIGGKCRLLIADEVGLGKTMQAAVLLKTQINQRTADRVLILTPKPARTQWQQELYRKFCLDIPILEPGPRPRLVYPNSQTENAPDPPWAAPRLIVTYQWMVRKANDFLAAAPQYDLVIVDEAHHARYQGTGRSREPNQFLRLLQTLSQRTNGLLLLTATPMQTDISDLRALLGLLESDGLTDDALDDFYADAADPTPDRIRRLRDLCVRTSVRPTRISGWEERVLWSPNPMPLETRLADPANRRALLRKMQETAPAKRLMSRHTRDLLESYQRDGLLNDRMPQRVVRSVPIRMNDAERELYDRIDDLVHACYDDPRRVNTTAMGFVMTIYRRRLGSSPRAYAQTCRSLLERRGDPQGWREIDVDDETILDETLPPSPLPLTSEQKSMLRQTIDKANDLPRSDTKRSALRRELETLRREGHQRIIVFTQFRDTQKYLIERLAGYPGFRAVNAIWGGDSQEAVPRSERIDQVRKNGGILICTETAAESLNLQFCSAIVNYDIPWNPMTLEQRIGRIDRIGQARPTVDVVNLFYDDTAEWDAYRAMEDRLKAIGQNVGPYRDILRSRLGDIIKKNALKPSELRRRAMEEAVAAVKQETRVDLDLLNSELSTATPAAPEIDMRELQRCLDDPSLLPNGWSAAHEGGPHWRITTPNGSTHSVTTDRQAYEYAAGRVEWFGPGSPAFPI